MAAALSWRIFCSVASSKEDNAPVALVPRVLRRCGRPRELTGRVRIVGLIQNVVRVELNREPGRSLLKPETTVHLSLEILAW